MVRPAKPKKTRDTGASNTGALKHIWNKDTLYTGLEQFWSPLPLHHLCPWSGLKPLSRTWSWRGRAPPHELVGASARWTTDLGPHCAVVLCTVNPTYATRCQKKVTSSDPHHGTFSNYILKSLLSFYQEYIWTLYLAYLLAFYLTYLLKKGILSGRFSGILSGILSSVFTDIQCGILTFYLAWLLEFCLAHFLAFLSGNLSGISSDIRCGISSGISSGILPGKSSGIKS